jgi:chemotaxis protein methyltransferase CheR
MDEYEYGFVKHKIRQLTGVDLNCYKSQQVQRRLNIYLLRSGYGSWARFFRAIQDDQEELGRLKDYLTINVTTFFRDPEKFVHLREDILPRLLHGRPRLCVWSAGCSLGHEPYSLAIMLAEATGPYSRHSIWATDIDHSALERARAGGPYAAEGLANVSPDLLDRYFRADGSHDGAYYVIDSLRRKVTFEYHNLLAGPFEGEFDLIVCRNVVIYLTREARQQLHVRFHDALRPGGVLFVGGTEVVSQAPSIGLEPLGVSFYMRPARIESLSSCSNALPVIR